MRLPWIAITAVVVSLAASNCGGLPEDNGEAVDAVEQPSTQAPPAGPMEAGGGTTKVTICHIPPGNPANAHTITVGEPAVRAHLAHGDTIGACGSADGGSGGGGGGGDGGGDGGTCGLVDTACTTTAQCCAGLTCASASGEVCAGGPCTCQVIIN